MALETCLYLLLLQKIQTLLAKMKAKKSINGIGSTELGVIPDGACSWLTHHLYFVYKEFENKEIGITHVQGVIDVDQKWQNCTNPIGLTGKY